MESKSNTVMCSEDFCKDDNISIKEELSNQDEVSTESLNHHSQQSETYFEECDEGTKTGIKGETWDPNIVSSDIKSGPKNPLMCLAVDAIKEYDEIYIKEEPWWYEQNTAGSHNEEKKIESDKYEAAKDILPLKSPRLSSKAVYLDNSAVNFLDVEKHTSHNIVCENNSSKRQYIYSVNCNLTCESGHFESEQNKDEESAQLYQCEICEKCYRHKSSLNNHKTLHSATPYTCDICKKIFTKTSHLKRHKLLHTGTKPHKCDICEKCFTWKSDLQRHTLLHTAIKPHKCEKCEKSFACKSTLQNHILLHSATKAYKCDICEKRFTWKSALQRHKLVHLDKYS